jgi:hypothetical protein
VLVRHASCWILDSKVASINHYLQTELNDEYAERIGQVWRSTEELGGEQAAEARVGVLRKEKEDREREMNRKFEDEFDIQIEGKRRLLALQHAEDLMTMREKQIDEIIGT